MNILQFADKVMSGRFKLERAHSREVLRMNATARNGGGGAGHAQFYAAAESGINRPAPNPLTSPEDYRQSYQRMVLIRAARQLEEDFPQVDAILKDFETYVVGELLYSPNTGNPDANRVIRDYMEEQFDRVDRKGMRDLQTLVKLMVRTEKRDGECGAIMHMEEDAIQMDFISADRIGNPLIGGNVGENNFNGIRTDPVTGAPVVYDIWKRLAHINAYVFECSVSANNFRHFFDPFRFDQYHGVTTFKNVITTCYDIRQIVESAQLNMKYRAAQLPYVMNEQGRPRGTGYDSVKTNAATGTTMPQTIAMGNGVEQQFVKLGEGYVEFPNDFPNQQFLPAYTELTRLIAMGAKLPPEFCFRSDAGGVLTRFHINKAERIFEEDKRRIRKFLNVYKNRSIQHGIDTGRLDLSKFGNLETSQSRFAGAWQMGRSVSVDYGREVDGDLKLIDAGLMTPEEHMQDNARDPEAVRESIRQHAIEVFQDAEQVAAKVNQPIEKVLPFILKKFPNPEQPAQGQQPAAKPELIP